MVNPFSSPFVCFSRIALLLLMGELSITNIVLFSKRSQFLLLQAITTLLLIFCSSFLALNYFKTQAFMLLIVGFLTIIFYF